MRLLVKENKGYKLIIPFKAVALTAYAIMIVPILLFLFGWIRWYFAILFSGILLFGAFWMFKKDYWQNKDKIEVPLTIFIGAAVVFSLWILLSGGCWFSVGYCDIEWRTTFLRDLMTREWPVFYPEKNLYLNYYFTYWLVPALFGKIFGMRGAWACLALQNLLLLLVAFLLIAYLFKDYKKSSLKVIITFMVLFSGVNILGMFLNSNLGVPCPGLSIGDNEGYTNYMLVDSGVSFVHYRSNQNFIEMIYNQLPIWIAVPLFLQNRSIHNYAFLGLILFPFSPWGTAGLALLMIIDAVIYLIKSKKVIDFLKEIFSIPNICAVISAFIPFALFLSATDKGGSNDALYALGFIVRFLDITKMTPSLWTGTIVFWLCEFGIFYLLTWKKFKKNYLYWAILIILILSPFLIVGPSRDWGMNSTLPALYILMIFLIYYFKEEIGNKNKRYHEKFTLNNCILLIMIGLSFTTSIFGNMNRISVMNTEQKISVQNKTISTFADGLGYEGYWTVDAGYPDLRLHEKTFYKTIGRKADVENYQRLPISNELSDIRNINEICEYLDYLAGKDCSILVSVQDTVGNYLSPEITQRMKNLGFTVPMDDMLDKKRHCFIGVLINGDPVFQQIGGDDHIYYDAEQLIAGRDVHMQSATWKQGNVAVIDIGLGKYSAHGRGFNIVVYDHKADRVIDSVAFDTYLEDIPCKRKVQ